MRVGTISLAATLVLAGACAPRGARDRSASATTPRGASSEGVSAQPGAVLTGPPQAAGDVNPTPALPTAHVPSNLPLGVSPVLYALSVPADRVPTAPQIELGDKLFNDKRLSVDDSTSCATCHDPKAGFVDHKPTSVGIKKQKGQRNAPTVLNAMFLATQFWDGRSATLEDQAKLPILNPIEMGQRSPDDVVTKLRGIPEYADAFRRVFGRDATYDDMATAIAAFERTQFAGEAPFDRFIMGDDKAIDAAAKRGWAVFNGKGRCNSCHQGNAQAPLFSDQKFHNIGVAARKQDFTQLAREALVLVNAGDQKQIDELAIQTKFSELGRFLITKQVNDIGAFKTPTLRNIAATGPYMHDGSMATLFDVVDHYNKGGVPNPFLDGGMQRLGLTEPEVDDLVRFLATLTTERVSAFARGEMAKQMGAKNKRPERDVAVAMGKKGDVGDVAPSPDLATKDPASNGVFGAYPARPAGGKHGQ